MTESIIVYRNPMEKAFWEMAMNGAYFPIMAACVAFLLIFIIEYKVVDMISPSLMMRRNWKSKLVTVLIWWSAGCGAAATAKYLWI